MDEPGKGRLLLAVLAAFAAAVGALACGGSDEDQIRDTLKSYTQAYLDSDPEAACEHVTEAALESLGGGGSCAETLQLAVTQPEATEQLLEDFEVIEVTVDGDSATATVSTAQGEEEVALVRENGDWLIDEGP